MLHMWPNLHKFDTMVQAKIYSIMHCFIFVEHVEDGYHHVVLFAWVIYDSSYREHQSHIVILQVKHNVGYTSLVSYLPAQEELDSLHLFTSYEK